jgi:hypothetical protein
MNRRTLMLTAAAGIALVPAAVSAPPPPIEIAPPPREALPVPKREAHHGPLATIELTTGGYQIQLPRAAAVKIRDFLNDKVDEKGIAAALQDLQGDEKLDPRTVLVAGVLARDIPAFKKELNDQMGADGVTVRVYGVRRGKDRPRLRMIAEALPEPARDAMQKAGAIIKTVPVHWTVTPRE